MKRTKPAPPAPLCTDCQHAAAGAGRAAFWCNRPLGQAKDGSGMFKAQSVARGERGRISGWLGGCGPRGRHFTHWPWEAP